MRIAIVGLGGVGAYIGAKFCALKEEHEILFIARGEHLRQIQKHGLKLIDINEEQVYHPTAALKKTDLPLDLIFLCTKSYHAKAAIAELSHAISEKTLIIPVANGVNNAERLRSLTPARLIDACVYIVSHKLREGVVKKETSTFALILDESVKTVLEPLFEKAHLRVKFSPEIKNELWKKFLFIAAMGAMTSYYQEGMGSIYRDHKDELEALLQEIARLGQAEEVALGAHEVNKALQTAATLPLDAPTSLWLDLQNGAQNELDMLCHYVIERAQHHLLPVPIMQKIYDRLKN
ncbi:MAG: 2-dehydropantoate 2-reductase [Campylobacterales bacterium]|nr:2-dehydropantoate 2-reductase [Campylobacterales bacterium]